MSTTLTATFPDLAFTPDTAGASIYGTPTMPMSALAWSLADAADVAEADAPAPVVAHPAATAPNTTERPRISPVAIVGMLFGGVTVVAALGAIVLGGNDSPVTPPVAVDHTKSAPYVAPAPATLPTVSHVAAPAVGVVAAPVTLPPRLVAPAQPVATPTAAESPEPTAGRSHWNWPRRIWQHHDQDGHDQHGQTR